MAEDPVQSDVLRICELGSKSSVSGAVHGYTGHVRLPGLRLVLLLLPEDHLLVVVLFLFLQGDLLLSLALFFLCLFDFALLLVSLLFLLAQFLFLLPLRLSLGLLLLGELLGLRVLLHQ